MKLLRYFAAALAALALCAQAQVSDRLNGVQTGLAVKAPVQAVATSNITLSGAQTVGGVAVTAGDRVLVTAQTSSVNNGIYVVDTSAWDRAADFDGNRDVAQGTLVISYNDIDEGVLYQVTSADPVVIGTSAITFDLRDDPLVTYVRTAAEIAASVTPTDFEHAPGNLLRYNNATSGVDASTAFEQAVNSNDLVTIPKGTWPLASAALRTGVSIQCEAGAILQRTGTTTLINNDAATTGNSIRGCTFDANNSYTNPVVSFTVGTNDFYGADLTFINFDNSTNEATLMLWNGSNAAANRDILLERISAEETGTAAENVATISIANPVNVEVSHSRFVNAGSVQTFFSTGYTTAAGPVRIVDNYFEGINSSTVLIRVNGANILQGVTVSNNRCFDQSPSLGKYCFTVGQHQTATTGGIVRGVHINYNTCRGSNDTFDGCILLGDSGLGLTEGSGAEVIGNFADFRDADGTLDTSGNTTQRGIWILNWDGATVSGNYVRGAQSFAYGLSDSTDVTFTGNVAVESLRNASATAAEGCYYLAQATISTVMFDGNYAIDCGGGGASHAGFSSANTSGITNVTFGTNHAIDLRGSPAMVYGYNMGGANTGIKLSRTMQATGFTTAAINGPGLNAAFASLDATPSVGGRTLSYNTANAGATVITNFDDGFPGQEIFVVIADANTTIDFSANANMRGNNGVDWVPGNGDHMRCNRFSTVWYCVITES